MSPSVLETLIWILFLGNVTSARIIVMSVIIIRTVESVRPLMFCLTGIVFWNVPMELTRLQQAICVTDAMLRVGLALVQILSVLVVTRRWF